MEGRNYVIPDDLLFLLIPVFAHRLLMTADAHIAGRSPDDVLRQVGRTVPIPQPDTTAATRVH
jgi:MoxR-like ATPase